MKKLFLFVAFVAFSFTASAQFNVGATFGLPTGDASDVTTFALGIDANYFFDSESDLAFGVSSGYLTYFVDEDVLPGADNAAFIPLAGAVRYPLSENFSLGADVGYALGVNDGNDGGFYYRPMVVYSISEKASINLSYSGVTNDGATLSNIGLGIMFGL